MSKSNSKIESAWNAFYESQKIESLEALLSEGWKTPEIVKEETGTDRTVNAVRISLASDSDIEVRTIKIRTPSGVRSRSLFRPKLRG